MMHGQPSIKNLYKFNVHGFVHRNNILVYNSNKMHKSLSLFYLTTALHVSGSHVPIIRRINCINTTSVICHSV